LKISYAYNHLLDAALGNNPGIVFLSKLNSPSNIVEFCEVAGAYTYASHNGGNIPADTPPEYRSATATGYASLGSLPNGAKDYATGNLSCLVPTTTPRHNGGSNWLACDGHAKWLMGTKVSNGTGLAAADQPGNASKLIYCSSGNMTDAGNGNTYALTWNIN
jgi:prepilin-type processing-associated H-X9-DG protein